jgi:hypothetical protein
LAIPVPAQVPPAVAAFRLNGVAPTQTFAGCVIVEFKVEVTVTTTVSILLHEPVKEYVIVSVPTPAIDGSNVPFVELVIPVPDHVPPEVAAERLKEDAATQTDDGCVIVASAVAPAVTVTCEELEGHVPLLMVHSKTFAPAPNPVTPDVGDVGDVILPEPLIKVHKPVPEAGVFPVNVVVVPQTVCGLPATEVVGGVTPVIVT